MNPQGSGRAFLTLPPSDASSQLFASFPESMFRALMHSARVAAPPTLSSASSLLSASSAPAPAASSQQQRVVPVLVLVPTTTAASSASSSASWQQQAGGALARLLFSAEAGAAGAGLQWGATSPPALPAPTAPPAALPAALPTTRPNMDAEDLPVSLPSFGERTAAAKKMLCAAPGGPVFSRSMSLPATTGAGPVSRRPPSVPFLDIDFNINLIEKRKNSVRNKKKICGFCKKNGESAEIYESHSLNVYNGCETVISCPVLRRLKCDKCGATGDHAHTRTHCPLLREKLPVAVILKQTRRKCDGSLRQCF